jgi:hypothetical protein
MADYLLVSPSEALALLRHLERRAVAALETDVSKLTAARLRNLEQYGIAPHVPGSGEQGVGGSRLYNVVDLALLRLWLRLSSEVGPVAARFTLAYVGRSVRVAIERRRPLVLVVQGKRAELIAARDASSTHAVAQVPVLGLLDGVEDAMRAVREESPELWAGRSWLTPAEAVAELAMA